MVEFEFKMQKGPKRLGLENVTSKTISTDSKNSFATLIITTDWQDLSQAVHAFIVFGDCRVSQFGSRLPAPAQDTLIARSPQHPPRLQLLERRSLVVVLVPSARLQVRHHKLEASKAFSFLHIPCQESREEMVALIAVLQPLTHDQV